MVHMGVGVYKKQLGREMGIVDGIAFVSTKRDLLCYCDR